MTTAAWRRMSTRHRLKAAVELVRMSLRHRGVARDVVDALARGSGRDLRCLARHAGRTPDVRAEKVVSRKFRYLWICNPKVASRSIMSALLSVDPDADVIFGKTASEVHAAHPEARSYYSFAFIRHPFDRALSWHVNMRFSRERVEGVMHHVALLRQKQNLAESFYGLAEVDGFDDFCAWLNTPYGSDAFADRHFLSQKAQISLEDGRLPDFIGCLENVEDDWRRVAARLALPVSELPRLNTMAGWRAPSRQALQAARAAARVLLTERNEALLRRRYAADLELYESVSKAGNRGRERRP